MVEISIKEALRLGIAAHKSGDAAKAQNLYLAILDRDPHHADANHNLGVLGVELNQINEALPFFEKAITSNNQVKQYWFSYIEALIKVDRDAEADIAIQKAKKLLGADSRLDSYIITKNPVSKVIKKNRSLNARIRNAKKFLKQKKYEEAKQICETVLNVFPGNVDAKKILHLINRNTSDLTSSVGVNIPSNVIKTLTSDYQKGYFEEVINVGAPLVSQYPNSVELLNIVAAAHSSSGKLQEAIQLYKRAIFVSPEQCHLFNNLGNAFRRLGVFEEATQNLKHALMLYPEYFDAHINLGLTYKDLNNADLALKHFLRARNINSVERLPNLLIVDTIANSNSSTLSQDCLEALTEITKDRTLWKPTQLSSTLTAIFRQEINFDYFKYNEFKENDLLWNTIELISKNELLQQFLKVCVIPDIEIEKLLKAIRKEVLSKLSKVSALNLSTFQSALALQCDVNEYIYGMTDEESVRLKALQSVIENKLERDEQPTSEEVLCFASYLPLRRLKCVNNLKLNMEIKEVYGRQVVEYEDELSLRATIKNSDLDNDISEKVRAQYEQNPYPRWITTSISNDPIDILQLASAIPLRLSSPASTSTTSLNILIAGCGTGVQAIEAATRFKNASVDAIDISTSSLAYAKRKADALKITNINFQHWDILNIDQLDKKFDIIESVGVLHHMENPISGWRALTKCMHAGSLMKIGLYSAKARETVNIIRDDVLKRKLRLNEHEIIDYRNSLIKQNKIDYSKILKFIDFYSLSEFRDLLFHVQEHQFTITEIKQVISNLGLTFCGFEVPENVKNAFGIRSSTFDQFNLDMWEELEGKNPDLFAGMYQFWVQKNINL